jgi:hypothetical protein
MENFMRLNSDKDIQIASWTSTLTGIAIPAHLQPHSRVNSSRNVHLDVLLFFNGSLSLAFFARICDDLSFTMTFRASHGHAEKAALLIDLARTAATGTFFHPFTARASATLASRTSDIIRNGKLFINPFGRFFKVDTDIDAFARSLALAATTA